MSKQAGMKTARQHNFGLVGEVEFYSGPGPVSLKASDRPGFVAFIESLKDVESKTTTIAAAKNVKAPQRNTHARTTIKQQ